MKFNFGWTNPSANIQDPRLIRYVQNAIAEQYLYETVFLTRMAGQKYQRYRNKDFEIMRVDFNFLDQPFVPTLLLVHTMDDPRNHSNVISFSLDLFNENMIRM